MIFPVALHMKTYAVRYVRFTAYSPETVLFHFIAAALLSPTHTHTTQLMMIIVSYEKHKF